MHHQVSLCQRAQIPTWGELFPMITVGNQVSDMADVFPGWSCERPTSRTAIWIGQLQPHKTIYTVRVEYTEPLLPEGRSALYVQPLVEILSPKLKRRFGNAEGSLPHVYVAHPRTNRSGPFLCLFDDKKSQWTSEDLISCCRGRILSMGIVTHCR